MNQKNTEQVCPAWMPITLKMAGIYNFVWGLVVILFPNAMFQFCHIELPRYPAIWQCVGMVVGVYGIGYWIAASHPVRHWPIVLVGFLGKLFGPMGFIWTACNGGLPWSWGMLLIPNDILWWLPFAVILYHAWRVQSDTTSAVQSVPWNVAIGEHRSQRGATLMELSHQKPSLVVFLRHAGCTFCHATLADLSRQRNAIEMEGVQLAVVHMSDPMTATIRLEQHELGDVHRFSDPHCQLYRAFGLQRATFAQLVNPTVWWRGFLSAIWQGHGFGHQDGDGFRMPGTFLLRAGKILLQHRPTTPADRPDFLSLIHAVHLPAVTSPPPIQGEPAKAVESV